MRIRTGSRILTGAIACGIVCLVAINIYGVRLINEHRQFDQLSREIGDTVFDLNILANDMGVGGTTRVSVQFRSRLAALDKLLENLAETPHTPQSVVERMKRSAKGLQTYVDLFEGLNPDTVDTPQTLRRQNAMIQSFLSASQTLSDLARRQSLINAQAIQKIEADVKAVSIATLVVTILLLSGVYIYIVGAILNPIVALHNKIVGIVKSPDTEESAQSNINELELISRELDDRLEIIRSNEEELAYQANELQRSNKDLEEFAYIASHDLKEPIRAISNHAQFLAEDHGEVLGEDGAKRIARIRTLCEKSERSISDLLEFSRIGRSDEAALTVDVVEVIDTIQESLSDFLNDQNARIRIEGPFPNVVGDPARIQSVFLNLIVNGVRYNDQPEKQIEIGYRPGKGGKRGQFYVKDNGIGIPNQYRDKIFTIFKRLHSDKTYGPGTGAGLSIVRKIVEQYGGTISVASIEEEGTEFVFDLTEADI